MLFIRFILAFTAFLIGIVLIIPALIVMLPFWFVTVTGKIIKIFKPKISEWEDIIEFDQKLGWKSKPNIDTNMEIDGVYHITIGKDGYRGNYDLKESDVVVIGDSFVFGQGTDDKHYFGNLTKLAKVKPVGAPGYGATHYLLLLKTLATELKGKLVIWFVYTGNDYREAIRPVSYGYHFPFVFQNSSTGKWEIKTDHITEKKLPFHFDKGYNTSMREFADLFSKNYLSDYAFSAFEYLTSEAKKHCDKNGAEFAVVTFPVRWLIDGSYANKIKRHASEPEHFSLTYPDEEVKRLCNRNGITFRACLNDFIREDFLPIDLHWSKKGNKKTAKIIDELYKSFLKNKSA